MSQSKKAKSPAKKAPAKKTPAKPKPKAKGSTAKPKPKPKPAAAKSKASTAKKSPAKPKATAAKPKPSAAKPKPKPTAQKKATQKKIAAKPKAATAKPKPSAAQKSPAAAKPKPKPMPKPTPPKKTAAKPKAATAKPKPSAAQKSPAAAKPKPKPTPPKKTAAKPKPPQPKKTQFTIPELTLRLVDLPEAELLRRDIERELLQPGKGTIAAPKRPVYPIIRNIEVENSAAIPQNRPPNRLKKRLLERKITRVARQGRLLLLLLEANETPNDVMVLDFGPGGLLRLCKSTEAIDPDTTVILSLTGSRQLRFLDTKVGAKMYVLPQKDLPNRKALLGLMGLDKMGLDPFGRGISWQSFYNRCNSPGARSKGLKSFLCDENLVLGVGDIYSDEILFHAGLNHTRETGTLSPTEARRFYRDLTGTLHEALKYRGTSLFGRPFLDLRGQPGTYGERLEVYQRKGELNSRGGTVERKRFSNRFTYFCNKTQLPKPLEDI